MSIESVKQFDPVTSSFSDDILGTQKLENKLRLIEQKKIIEGVLSNKQSKILLGMLLIDTGYLDNSFSSAAGDIHKTAYLEGRRSVGEVIYKLLTDFDIEQPIPHECFMAYREWDKQFNLKLGMYINEHNEYSEQNSDIINGG